MIDSAVSRNDYVGNNSLATYAFEFKIFEKTDLRVVRIAADGTKSVLVVDTDYTVDGVGEDGGGEITLTAGNLPTGALLHMRRVRPLLQETNLSNQGSFYPETYEDALDHLAMLAQQLSEESSRSVKLPEQFDSEDFDPALPEDITEAEARVLMSKPDGSGLQMGPTLEEVVNAEASANDAAASATEAESWATKMDGTVDGSEYSAKYYAEGAAGSALAAESAAQGAEEAMTEAQFAAGEAEAAAELAQQAADQVAGSAAQSLEINNNVTDWTDLGVDLDALGILAASIFFAVERISDAEELIGSGHLFVSKISTGYRTTEGPVDLDTGVELRAHPTTGVLQYKSSNMSGTISTARIVLRVTSLEYT